jgi:predicted amidophosphoribosyltransferase
MKVCIHCGRENEDNAASCAGCGKSLNQAGAEEVDRQAKDPTLDPVVVATFKMAEEASLLQARLQAEGIEAWVPEDLGVEYSWEYASVLVPAKDAQAAKEVAEEFFKNTETPPSPKSAEPGEEEVPGAGTAGSVPGRRRCVSCGAWIPYDSTLCPKCGYTQPQLV